MLNCFKDYKRYIHTSNHILDFAWPKLMKLTLKWQYMLSVLHSQYHACWCSGDLTHWGQVTHICVGNLIIIGSDNGLSPGRRQAIIWTNAGTLLIGTSGPNFSEILIEIITFSFKKNVFERVVCEMAAILSRPQCVKEPGHQQTRYYKINIHISIGNMQKMQYGTYATNTIHRWA